MGLPALIVFVAATGWAGGYLTEPVLRTAWYGLITLLILAVPLLRRAALTVVAMAGLAGATIWAWQNRQTLLAHAETWRGAASSAFQRLEASLDRVSSTLAEPVPSVARPLLTNPYRPYLEKVDPRNPEVNRLASRLARRCDDADHLCETVRLLEYVTDEIAYRADPRGAGDYVKSPLETAAAGAGDCEDQAILLVSLLESLGNETFLAFTASHTFPLVCYETSVDTMLARKQRELGSRAFRRYVLDLAPHHNAAALRQAARRVVVTRIDGRYCYPLEPTARGSWLGYDHREPLVAVFDSVQGTPVVVGR